MKCISLQVMLIAMLLSPSVCHCATSMYIECERELAVEPTVTEPSLPVIWSTTLPGGLVQLGQSADGKYVIVVGGGVSCLNDSTGVLLWKNQPFFFGDTNGRFLSSPQLTVLKNHPWFLLGGDVEDTNQTLNHRGVISIRSYPTGEVVRDLFLHRDSTDGVYSSGMGAHYVVSDDEQYVAAATVRGFITVWNLATGTIELEIPPTQPKTIPLCFTRDSMRLVVITYNSTDIKNQTRMISCIDLVSQTAVWTIERDHYGRYQGSMTADGKHICYSNLSGKTIESFPGFETILDKHDYYAGNGWFTDDNASHVITWARYADLTPIGIMLYNVVDSSELLLDTTASIPFAATMPGSMYHYNYDQFLHTGILKKVAFNWSMSAPEELRQIAPPSFGPNPCTSQGTLRYTVPGTARVSVAIYATDGRLEETVLSEAPQSGEQQLIINCQALTKGVHVLGITIGNNRTSIQILTIERHEVEKGQ